jgi:hypothetical protein
LPSRAAAAPTTPSLPTIAASIISPVDSPITSETMARVGKIHRVDRLARVEQYPLLVEKHRLEVRMQRGIALGKRVEQ